jgi:nucleotide-binding universal stress UspA family protein
LTAISPRSILAALDESVHKTEVLDAAAEVARRSGAKLHLIRVLLVPPEIPPGAHTVPDHLEEQLVTGGQAELRSLAAKVPDVAFGTPLVVIDGSPWRRIVEAAKALDVDLIVVGNHKHHGLDRVFESLAGKVIDHTDRNVLVVRVRDLAGGHTA